MDLLPSKGKITARNPLLVAAEILSDVEFPDQGSQTEPMHAPERNRPPGLSVKEAVTHDEGVMEMGNDGDVPGGTGQGACTETVYVVDEMCEDDLDGILGKPSGKRWVCHRILWRWTRRRHFPDPGPTSVPNPLDKELCHCGQQDTNG